MQKYPVTEVEFFKKDDTLTGIIKVICQDEISLQNLIENRLSIFHQKYIVETYKPKPRVVKCNQCQRFGHISRLCRSEHPICGKCSSHDHNTVDCEVTPNEYKCAHCKGKHITGHKDCEVMKEKLENLLSRRQDGI